jgi:hypothetical protein
MYAARGKAPDGRAWARPPGMQVEGAQEPYSRRRAWSIRRLAQVLERKVRSSSTGS